MPKMQKRHNGPEWCLSLSEKITFNLRPNRTCSVQRQTRRADGILFLSQLHNLHVPCPRGYPTCPITKKILPLLRTTVRSDGDPWADFSQTSGLTEDLHFEYPRTGGPHTHNTHATTSNRLSLERGLVMSRAGDVNAR